MLRHWSGVVLLLDDIVQRSMVEGHLGHFSLGTITFEQVLILCLHLNLMNRLIFGAKQEINALLTNRLCHEFLCYDLTGSYTDCTDLISIRESVCLEESTFLLSHMHRRLS